VTTWGGTLLETIARKNLKIGDTVRIQIEEVGTRYFTIVKFCGKTHCIGKMNDPYRGGSGITCDECGTGVTEGKFYKCSKDNCTCSPFSNSCNYHACVKCCKKAIRNHPHRLASIGYVNGKILKFPLSAISEIPDWSKNTQDFDGIYNHPCNMRRAITGSF
jgi:hypothetical protein